MSDWNTSIKETLASVGTYAKDGYEKTKEYAAAGVDKVTDPELYTNIKDGVVSGYESTVKVYWFLIQGGRRLDRDSSRWCSVWI